MQFDEIRAILRKLAPEGYAEEWDNVGLLAGNSRKEVKKIYLALDATDRVIEEAAAWGADMLLTHHPLIFKTLKRVNDEDFIGRRVLSIIRHDMVYYAMHTNFDVAPGCMADLAAERINLKDTVPMEVTGESDGIAIGVGRVGILTRPLTLSQLGELVKKQFGLPFVTVYGDMDSGELLVRAAISPGSGESEMPYALAAGAQVLITGDIGHHHGIDAVAGGMAVIDGGHYGLEHIFMEFMEGYLKDKLGDGVEIMSAGTEFPSSVL